jgi:hypothetical protein
MAKKNNTTQSVTSGLTSNFKLSSTAKRIMALQYTDPHRAGEYKRCMIHAEHDYASNKKKRPGRSDVGSDD